MDKREELDLWKAHLRELTPVIVGQFEWLKNKNVVASVNPDCPEKLIPVAQRLVALQNSEGEYQRNQISKEDVERIKYFSKMFKISFEDVIQRAVSNSRYISKDIIEARGVVGFILDIQSVYEQFYPEYGVFPINAMDAEVKRACRNFKTDVTLTEKIEAIIEVFLPELMGINITEKDFSIVPQTKYELTEEEVFGLVSYFKSIAEDGKIDRCFDANNQQVFLKACSLLAKANLTLDEFLKKWTNLTYTKCYSADIIPATRQMVLSYKEKHGTTTRIRDLDPYLRSKLDAAERVAGKYSVRELLTHWQIQNDNDINCRNSLTIVDLAERELFIISRLKKLYPNGMIDKDFIKEHTDLYEEIKLLSNRLGATGINDYLQRFGFSRESYHAQASENVIYLSSRDLQYYGFDEMVPIDYDECQISELNPRDYFGVYNKLVVQGMDSIGLLQKHSKKLGE